VGAKLPFLLEPSYMMIDCTHRCPVVCDLNSGMIQELPSKSNCNSAKVTAREEDHSLDDPTGIVTNDALPKLTWTKQANELLST
jgi:hypothetical protein